MRFYDIFNGDADGICALHQLRLAEPREATLISGVKRDVRLLRKLAGVTGASLTVLDISLDSNRAELLPLLESCQVLYIDHHFAGDLPASANLTAHIDPAPEVCTSIIVDRLLAGRFRPWAVAAAFGDNLHESAKRLAAESGLTVEETESLRELGELMNYNGYGRTVEDLFLTPQDLYKAVQPYENPLEFMARSESLARLREGFRADMELARTREPQRLGEAGLVYRFPNEPWARRSAGVFSNEKARENPNLATALVVDNGDGTLLISVRAPLTRRSGADELCRRFPTGGGRAAAAGVNNMPESMMDEFIQAFAEVFAP